MVAIDSDPQRPCTWMRGKLGQGRSRGACGVVGVGSRPSESTSSSVSLARPPGSRLPATEEAFVMEIPGMEFNPKTTSNLVLHVQLTQPPPLLPYCPNSSSSIAAGRSCVCPQIRSVNAKHAFGWVEVWCSEDLLPKLEVMVPRSLAKILQLQIGGERHPDYTWSNPSEAWDQLKGRKEEASKCGCEI